ncbi:MAG TPA: hypothetical protein VF667_12380 [Pseudonocardia sp.]
MSTLDVRDDLEVREEFTRLVADLDRRWPELPRSVVLPYSPLPVVLENRGTPWLYGPAWRDPLLGEDGPGFVPRRVRSELRRMVAADLPFDDVAVAHELDPEGPVRALRPLLADGPRTCTDEVARALVGPVPDHSGVARAVGILDALVGGPAPWAADALEVLLDPIVFGVVAPYGLLHGAPAVFQPLAAWRW